ncbi:MAG: cytoskeletal protein RodZ [Rickettsiales bacterium]|jgi:cytoskeletal protein RodZ
MLVGKITFIKTKMILMKEFVCDIFSQKEDHNLKKSCAENVGEKLKNRRESLEISVEKISGYLKIKEDYVLLLEKNDIETLSRKIYLTGFVRSYCSFLKIDDETIDQYLLIIAGGYSKNHLLNLDYQEKQNPNRKYLVNSSIILITLYLVLMIFGMIDYHEFDLTKIIIENFNQNEEL